MHRALHQRVTGTAIGLWLTQVVWNTKQDSDSHELAVSVET